MGLRDWHLVCRNCSYEGSSLPPRILEQAVGGDLDEAARSDALEVLRRENFARLLRFIVAVRGDRAGATRPARLLDVGCAHGWFLEQGRNAFEVVGIEPDTAVAEATLARGLPVRAGFFPDVLAADERFDVIVFNDVLEHIPDLHATLKACHRHLLADGLLVVNAPDRCGVLYRMSKLLLRLGAPGSFNRMWQEGFPSPHVHYFDEATLLGIARRHEFVACGTQRLASVSAAGLYDRVRYSREVPAWKAAAVTLAVILMMPVLGFLPSDIRVWLFRKHAAPDDDA